MNPTKATREPRNLSLLNVQNDWVKGLFVWCHVCSTWQHPSDVFFPPMFLPQTRFLSARVRAIDRVGQRPSSHRLPGNGGPFCCRGTHSLLYSVSRRWAELICGWWLRGVGTPDYYFWAWTPFLIWFFAHRQKGNKHHPHVHIFHPFPLFTIGAIFAVQFCKTCIFGACGLWNPPLYWYLPLGRRRSTIRIHAQ